MKKTDCQSRPAASVSEFQARVYAALAQVPAGRVITYGGLAAAVGCAAPRAVGQALRRNPFAPAVPCHRVVAAGGRLGGFQGRRTGAALRRKLELLASEGVYFHAGRLVDPQRLLQGSLPHSPTKRGSVVRFCVLLWSAAAKDPLAWLRTSLPGRKANFYGRARSPLRTVPCFSPNSINPAVPAERAGSHGRFL